MRGLVAFQALNEASEGTGEPVLINLASQEYFGAVDLKALKLALQERGLAP